MAQTFNRLDPIILEQQARYLREGLTYVSNNNNIIPRDAAGNIIMQEGSDTNPLLIIDPVTERISTKSALRVLNTRFQYFKFPTQIRTVATSSIDIDLNTSLLALTDVEISPDPIYARYKPADDYAAPITSAANFNDGAFTGTAMDEVVEGAPQVKRNIYFITKDIKNSNVDLRFRIKMYHSYRKLPIVNSSGKIQFSIIKQGPDTPINRRYLVFPESDSVDITTNSGDISFITTTYDVVIPNNSFEIGDMFSIGCKSAQAGHTIISEQTYWVITDASKNVDEWNQEI